MNLLKKANYWCHDDTNQHINKKTRDIDFFLNIIQKFLIIYRTFYKNSLLFK